MRFLMRPGAPFYYFLKDGSVWRRNPDGIFWRVQHPLPWPIIASRVEIDGPRRYHPELGPMAFFYWIGAVAKASWDYLTWLVRGRRTR